MVAPWALWAPPAPWGYSPIPLGTATHWDMVLIPVLLPGRTWSPSGTQPTLDW